MTGHTNDQDELERMLTHELHDRADGLGGAGFGFADVKGRAGRIRRNRRLAAGAGVAAAMAIVIPTVVSAGGLLSGDGRQVDPAVPSPAPVEVARTTLTLDGLPRGEAPEIEYFTPEGVVLPDRGLVRTDRSFQALVPSVTDGGYIAVEPDGQHLRALTEDFEPTSGSAKTNSFVTTTERDQYAFVAVEAGAQTLVSISTTDPEGALTWDLPTDGVADVVGYLAEDRVVVENIDQRDGTTDILVAEPDGSLTELPGYLSAQSTDQANGLVAVQTEAREDGTGCFGVVDPAAPARPLWETCAAKLGAFSPDGRYVMSTASDSDGFGLRNLDVHDAATGDLVASFSQASNTAIDLVHPTWERPDAVVAVAVEGETTTLVRLGLDGSVEEVADRTEGPYGDLTYYLGQDRRSL